MDAAFCTVLSRERLYQAIALFLSLNKVMNDFRLFTLCIDDDTYNILRKMNLKNISLIHVDEMEDENLLSIRKKRKLNEYCWTLKPIFIESIMSRQPSINRVTYIDADLFFWQDPNVIFRNQPDCSVLLTRQDICAPGYDPVLIRMLQKIIGSYNSGFISFKRDSTSYSCLNWWKEQCLKSCIDLPDEGKFGDQGYLDEMPSLFPNICDISTPGVNIGHWNSPKFKFSMCNGDICIDKSKLICYHFNGFRILDKSHIKLIYEEGKSDLPFFYTDYKQMIKHIIDFVEEVNPGFNGYSSEKD